VVNESLKKKEGSGGERRDSTEKEEGTGLETEGKRGDQRNRKGRRVFHD